MNRAALACHSCQAGKAQEKFHQGYKPVSVEHLPVKAELYLFSKKDS
jgi:hypothetical protein